VLREVEKMKILLILSDSRTKHGLFDKIAYTSFYPSITLEQLISVTPDKYEVEYVDERWEDVDLDWDGTLVGISTLTPSAHHAYEIADEFRKRGKTVVLGGYHPSALPEEAKQHADSVVIGEAEISWPQLLRDFENGGLKPFYRSTSVDPEMIPSPNKMPKSFPFIGFGTVQATRGCPNGCKYCAIQNVEGSCFRAKSVKKVIEEIKSIQSKRLFFADSSLTTNSSYTKKLFQEMIGLNKKFSCYGNINVLHRDDELLKLASEAGCEQWLIGFDSVDQETIRYIGKKSNKVDEYVSAVKKIRDYDMSIMGMFVFGFDTDKPNIFETTLKTIYKMELDRPVFSVLTPFPGTALFNELEKEGRILTKDWSKYNLRNVVFQPKNFSTEQLLNGTLSIIKEFYSFPKSLRIRIDFSKYLIGNFF
jgi:radical SAM superfamily enzyme YgiQ (UPF0313 family)